jgi:hypothetical protein
MVAAVARGAVRGFFPRAAAAPQPFGKLSEGVRSPSDRTSLLPRSIPRRELDRIAREYGWWAARRAEAGCPQGDVACGEREAKRLYQVTRYRRR